MIKFKGQDGTQPMTLKDNGEMQFNDKKVQEDFEKAEKEVNKIQDK